MKYLAWDWNLGWTLALVLSTTSVPAAPLPQIYPVEDLRPGQRGITRTVLQGTQIEEIQTEILGVQKAALGAGHDLIIGRLIDPRTEKTGAVHGMSGSPLYIDGKLVGALSRRITLFEKDGHCGFTPAADMFDVERRSSSTAPEPWQGGWWTLLAAPFTGSGCGSAGQWLSVPLPVPGWGPAMEQAFKPFFENIPGFLPVAAAAGRADSSSRLPLPLKDGSPLAVVLVDGDFSMAGTGTLTWTDGHRFMAFGHPMMGLGSAALPVAPAEIITTIPSYFMPHKLSNAGSVSGTLTQDRLSAISGTLDRAPAMAPYRIKRTHNGEPRPDLKGRLALHPRLSPMLVAMLMARTLNDEQDTSEYVTVRLHGSIQLQGLPALVLDGVYSGDDSERMRAVMDQALPLLRLCRDFPRQVAIEGLELSVESFEKDATWQIDDLRPSATTVRPGESIRLLTRLRSPAGVERWVEQVLALPEEVREGTVEVRVLAGSELRQERLNDRDLGRMDQPRDFLRALDVSADADRLYAQVNLLGPAVATGGFLQAGLPGSIARQQAGTPDPVRSTRRTVAEVSAPQQGVVAGSRQFTLRIIP
ncbi:MAG: SpoIVB peptidase S55 domain-containing protein [Candidatus Methylacidiphilales bacterium]|nr:SpoIVB peptidase S55 domain-containing protein [Candidatus Methylacidiphilales bacterium]